MHGVDDNKQQSQTAEIVNVKPLASQLAGVENVKIDTLQSDSTVITGNKAGTTDNDNSQTDKTGPFSGLKFKQNSFLSTVPSVTNMHSMHFNAREAFLGVIRKATWSRIPRHRSLYAERLTACVRKYYPMTR